ncbi:MAG: terminase family protein [Akkermansia sp.]|nr:terminase family protein [Akkermansia sp.]
MGKYTAASATREAKPKGSAPVETAVNPLSKLLPYQRAWYEDGSRFLVGRWGRQTGKSFSTAAIVAAAMIAQANTMWMIAAPSERQSHEALEKVKQWLAAFECAFADELEELDGIEGKAGVVRLTNGSRCIAVPGKPDTVRGMSANVWLDEFAFFEDPDATWKAILPSITNPLRGGEKRVILTSTPNGKAGRGKRFYDICTAAAASSSGVTSMRWSHYHIPLRSAIADGLPVDYETLAAAIGDPLAVRQELDAEFVDTQSQLLPTEIILRAESEEATLHPAADVFGGGRDLRVGVDVGRVSDPTVIWTAERLGDVLYTREVLVLAGMSHADQLSIIRARVAAATRCCMDYTGMGIGMGDMLVREFGEYKPETHKFGRVELCTFSAAMKREIFPKLRESMEACRLRIPADPALRTDLSAMQQVCSGGQFSYEAPRTKDGHSDRCTAAALCVRAGEGSGNVPLPARLATGEHQRVKLRKGRRNHIGGGMRSTNYELRSTK